VLVAGHEIRPALLGDAEALAATVIAIGGFRAFAGWSQAAIAASVRTNVAATLAGGGSTLLVVEHAEELIGWAQAHWLHDLFLPGPEGYLTELFLVDAHRGVGIGTELLDRVVAEARERGAYRLTLLNGTERASYARQFYRKRGWQERADVAGFVLLLQD
jgi:GNAT superfamily N-acetyltransferase